MWFKKKEVEEQIEQEVATPLYLRFEKLFAMFRILEGVEDKNLSISEGGSVFGELLEINFKSALGRVFIVFSKHNRGFESFPYSYKMKYCYYKKETRIDLFRLLVEAKYTALSPTLLKDGKLSSKTIDLAIHELESYVYNKYDTYEDIKKYHKRQIFKLGGI